MTIRRKIVVLLLCCCTTLHLQAQQHYKAALNPIPQTAFYEITITPELSACLNADMSDLRIADSSGNMAPYIIRNSKSVIADIPYTELPVKENKIADSGRSQVIIQNTTGKSIRTLLITTGNTEVTRKASLSGSKDGKKWYIISDKITLEPSFATGTANEYTQKAGIPANNYAYLKLLIDNEHADPIHIIRISVPDDHKKAKPVTRYAYRENPGPEFIQNDSSDGNSYVTVRFSKPYHTDMLHLSINAPRYYERTVTVRAPGNDTTESCSSCNQIGDFSISAAGRNNFETNRFKTRILQLIIANQDNPPVHVGHISSFQKLYTIVAWLEKGNRYQLLAGDRTAERPHYDLEHFTDSIPPHISNLAFGTISVAEPQQPVLLPVTGGRKLWLWATIASAVLLLAVFSWRLLREMKRSGI